MSEGGDYLIPVEGLGLKPLGGGSLESLTRTSEYLPQVRVYGASNDVVVEGNFPMGHFGLYFKKETITDLTEQFDCLVIYARPRACIIGGDAPVSFYGKQVGKDWEFSKEFEEVKAKAMSKNNQGYLCGLEYLLWIPSVEKFALFLMGNPTLRRESDKVLALVGKAATLKIRFIKSKAGYSWHGASCFPCSTPLVPMPDQELMKKEIVSFTNPEETQVELAEEEGRAR
jgi:hypothetical protein